MRDWRKRQLAASVATYITLCDDALRAELARHNGEWPDSVTVPMWPGEIERLALVHWMDELTAKIGKRIRIDFETPLSDDETTGPGARLH